jgi:hypothetical protein
VYTIDNKHEMLCNTWRLRDGIGKKRISTKKIYEKKEDKIHTKAA